MFHLSDQLHPALVHFPVVLLILGGIGAVVAIFTDRWNLRKWVSLFLTIGAIGAFGAVRSGDEAKETTGSLSETAENLLDQHAELAHQTRNFAVAAALFGLISAFVKLKGAFRSRSTSGYGRHLNDLRVVHRADRASRRADGLPTWHRHDQYN
jgi:hypothetical protein